MSTVVHFTLGDLPNAGRPWDAEDDSDLLDMHAQHCHHEAMVAVLGRTPQEIAARLEQLKRRASANETRS
jgi:hypothetical protein